LKEKITRGHFKQGEAKLLDAFKMCSQRASGLGELKQTVKAARLTIRAAGHGPRMMMANRGRFFVINTE